VRYGAVLALVGLWPAYVFTGSQWSYVLATIAAAIAAVGFARRRSALVVVFLLAMLALIGTDVNGELGKGAAALGSLRIFDVAVAAAALAAGWAARRDLPPLSRPRSDLTLLALGAGAYLVLRWVTSGHGFDIYLRTDVRLVVLAVLAWVVGLRCREGGSRVLVCGLLGVGAAAAVKAGLIHATGTFAIGSNDRLQASSAIALGERRTILVGGGDTLLILVPAVAVLLAATAKRIRPRFAVAACGLGCLAALGLSGTRTSVLVALGLAAVAGVALLRGRRRVTRRQLTIAGVAVTCAIGVALLGAAPARLFESDAAHAGINFRKDEIDHFFDLPLGDQLLGQGFGGRIPSSDALGRPVLSAWTHVLPVWLALKAGLPGMLAAVAACALLARRFAVGLRTIADPVPTLTGGLLILGLLVMSLTINRIALIEGGVLLAFAMSLLDVGERRH
jgi:hypothetical protein